MNLCRFCLLFLLEAVVGIPRESAYFEILKNSVCFVGVEKFLEYNVPGSNSSFDIVCSG